MKRLLSGLAKHCGALAVGAIAFGSQLATSNAAQFQIIPTNQMWRYIVPNATTFCLNGTGWETPGFNDSAWSGPAPGGFTGGETTAATVTSLAGWLNTTTLPAPNGAAIQGAPYYFRTHFTLASTNALSLYFTNRVDDQAVWYINGVRVFDDNHPNNPEVCPPGGAGGGEATTNFVFTLTDAQLGGIVVVGDNVLAVSVHQNGTGSSDLVFGTTMWGENIAPDSPITITSSPTNITVAERSPATFTVSATGAPQNYHWLRNGAPIIGAPNAASYTIPNTLYPADNGAMFSVIVSNSTGPQTSGSAMLTVIPDTTAPTVISAIGDINPDDGQPTLVRLTFSEPMDPVLVNEANFILFKTGTDPDDPMNSTVLFPLTAVLTNGSNALIYTEARLPQTDYSIRMLDQRDASSGNNPTDPNPLTVPLKINELLIGFDANNVWKYAIETNLFGTGWETVGYNDSDPGAWPEGPAGLGVDASVNGVPIRTATAYAAHSEPQFFRRHFFLPSGTNGLLLNMRYVFEDGAVVYINGQEAGRFNVGAGALTVATRATANQTDPTPISGPVQLPTTNVVPGDNVIAVVVIQNGATSSDIELALELKATISQFAAGPPTITSQPVGQTVSEGANVTLSVGVSGGVPLHYQWRSNGVPIGGANSSSYTLFGAKPSYSGTYSVVVTNDLGTVTSAGALLTVNPDTTVPTLWGVNVDSNRTQLTLSFSKPLDTASAQTPGNYSVEPLGGSPIAVTAATEVNNTNVVLTLASPLVDGQSMNLVFNGVVDRTEAAHQITPRTNGVASLVSLSAAQSWRYNESGIDMGTAWHATAFNDSTWPTGAALFDVTRGATRDTVGGEPVRTVLSLTNLLPGDAATNITYYFRTHFTLPVSSNNIPTRINLFLDDGAVFYINNAEAYRNGITNVPVAYTNFAQTSVGTASRLGSFAVDGSSMVAGDNVLAVEVHQTSITSSDVTLGVELYAIVPGGLPNTPQARVRISYNAITGQTTVSWTAAGCTLQETTTLAIPSGSTVWGNSPVANGVPFTATGNTKFYRLSCP